MGRKGSKFSERGGGNSTLDAMAKAKARLDKEAARLRQAALDAELRRLAAIDAQAAIDLLNSQNDLSTKDTNGDLDDFGDSSEAIEITDEFIQDESDFVEDEDFDLKKLEDMVSKDEAKDDLDRHSTEVEREEKKDKKDAVDMALGIIPKDVFDDEKVTGSNTVKVSNDWWKDRLRNGGNVIPQKDDFNNGEVRQSVSTHINRIPSPSTWNQPAAVPTENKSLPILPILGAAIGIYLLLKK